AGSLRAAALDHEVRDDPVKDEPVVEAVAGELAEVGDGRRGVVVEELDGNRARARVQGGGGHARTVPAGLRVSGIRGSRARVSSAMPLRQGVGGQATVRSRRWVCACASRGLIVPDLKSRNSLLTF